MSKIKAQFDEYLRGWIDCVMLMTMVISDGCLVLDTSLFNLPLRNGVNTNYSNLGRIGNLHFVRANNLTTLFQLVSIAAKIPTRSHTGKLGHL